MVGVILILDVNKRLSCFVIHFDDVFLQWKEFDFFPVH